MSTKELETRLESLEREVALLKARAIPSGPPAGAWRSTIGILDNDPDYSEVIRLGREYRRQQNEDRGE